MDTINALSLTPPWGSLMAFGLKKIETRSWSPRMSTPFYLAIHQTKWIPVGVRGFISSTPSLTDPLERLGFFFHDLPRGAVIAVVRVQAIYSTNSLDDLRGLLTSNEREFGDFSENRYAWVTDWLHRLEEPIEVRGKQSLWPWEPPRYLAEIIQADIRERSRRTH